MIETREWRRILIKIFFFTVFFFFFCEEVKAIKMPLSQYSLMCFDFASNAKYSHLNYIVLLLLFLLVTSVIFELLIDHVWYPVFDILDSVTAFTVFVRLLSSLNIFLHIYSVIIFPIILFLLCLISISLIFSIPAAGLPLLSPLWSLKPGMCHQRNISYALIFF